MMLAQDPTTQNPPPPPQSPQVTHAAWSRVPSVSSSPSDAAPPEKLLSPPEGSSWDNGSPPGPGSSCTLTPEVHPLLLLPAWQFWSSLHLTGLSPLHRELVNPFLGKTVMPILPSKESWCLCSHCYYPKLRWKLHTLHAGTWCFCLQFSLPDSSASKIPPTRTFQQLLHHCFFYMINITPYLPEAATIKPVLQNYNNLPFNPELSKCYCHRKRVGSGFHQCWN